MKLLGNNITYDAYTAATLTADDNMHGRIEDIKDEISSNFLKVKHTSGVMESIAALDQFRIKHFQVDIFFGSMETTNIMEHPKYTATSFMNSLGGTLSLWLGISLIMVFEAVELAIRLLLCLISSIHSHL